LTVEIPATLRKLEILRPASSEATPSLSDRTLPIGGWRDEAGAFVRKQQQHWQQNLSIEIAQMEKAAQPNEPVIERVENPIGFERDQPNHARHQTD
jgi:hypothetical protein